VARGLAISVTLLELSDICLMEASAAEGCPAADACPPFAKAPAQSHSCIEDTLKFGTVVTASIKTQGNLLKVSCSKMSGAAVSFELRSDDTLADLEVRIRDVCKLQSMSFFSDDGEILIDLRQLVKEFMRLTVIDSGDRKKLEHWKKQYPMVGKILAAMKAEAFNPKSNTFDSRLTCWPECNLPDIEPADFDALIDETLGAHAMPVDIARSHYVQVLGRIVEDAERWNMMNLQLLQNFDPGLKSMKHQFYGIYLEIARAAALSGVVPTDPGLVVAFRKNEEGRVVGACHGPPQKLYKGYIDRNLDNSLNLSDLRLTRDYSRTTRHELLRILQSMQSRGSWLPAKPPGQSSQKLEGTTTNESFYTLLNIQQRLMSEVCPVVVDGDLTHEMAELLAESAGYCFDVVRSLGGLAAFMLDKSNTDGDGGMQAQGLQAHGSNILAKSSAAHASGSLIFVVGVTGQLAQMLAPACRHLKEQSLPKSVRFVVCTGFVC